MSVKARARLGPYEILAAIGTGGMGESQQVQQALSRAKGLLPKTPKVPAVPRVPQAPRVPQVQKAPPV
jgi:hypothetical protein